MALQLVLDANGNYTYQDVAPQKTTPVMGNEFEAYEKKPETKLAGDTNIGEQTQQLIRETPGQYTTTFNEQTGQFETKTKGDAVTTIPFQAPTGTTTTQPQETALQKVQRITAGTRPSSSPVDFRGELQAMQDKALKAQRVNTLIRGGVDLGVSYLRASQPLNIQQTTTPLLNVAATPIGQSTLGGVGTAGALGYTVSRALGGDKKESTAAGAGAAIGTAVGGPIGGVVGGVIGKVIGGRVICTELYKQNLMSKEDYLMDLSFTQSHMIPKYGDEFLQGYWSFAVPAVKKMRQSKWHTKFWKHIACNRAKDIKWRLGKGKFNIFGRAYSLFFENLCWAIGKVKKTKVNFEELYT